MPQIQNTDAITAIRKGARLSISEGFPQELGKTVVPVMDMTPRFHRNTSFLRTLTKSTSGGGVVFTSSSTKETYITGFSLSFVKDATCDTASDYIIVTVVIDGATRYLVSLPVLTLTAERGISELTFPFPIAIDKGAICSLGANAHTAGNYFKSVSVFGYEVEP